MGGGLITFPDWSMTVNHVVFTSVSTLLSRFRQKSFVS